MASVKKIGNSWYYVVDLGRDPKTGKRKQKKKGGFKRQQDAKEALLEVQKELQLGAYVEEKEILFKDFAYQWLNDYEARRNPKPGTIRIRKHEINRLMDHFEHLQMKEINRVTFQKAIDELCGRFSNSTMSGVYNTGRAIFRKAVEWEVIKKDPTEYTHRKVKDEEKEELPHYMEKEELAAFLKAVNEHGLYMDDVIFYTLAYTGLRIGELIALQWNNVDLNSNTLDIKKTLYNPTNNKNKYTLVDVKTKKSKRSIYIDDAIVDLLKKQRKEQNELKMAYRNEYQDNNFVFTDEHGLPIMQKTIFNRLKRLLNKTDLDKHFTLHSFRHTHVSLMAEAEVPLEAIMERLGHKDDSITKEVYLHVTKKVKKEASHKFAKLMKDFM